MKNKRAISLLILLGIVLPLCIACAPHKQRRIYVAPPPKYKTHVLNQRFEQLKDKNFSVLRTDMALRGMSMDSPMYIRAFKSEMILEIWVKSAYNNQYELFKSYNICQKSGILGPKLKEGDKQTPEGFYNVTKDRLNPNSQYFLSFNIGFPNAYDRFHGRTGSLLMIHGNCVSVGCLAMTDEQIGEIYMIVENNFKYGHKSIPIHIFPFRMSEQNMNQRTLSRWYPFWLNLKQGYDYFERHRTPPRIKVDRGEYVIKPHRHVVTNALN